MTVAIAGSSSTTRRSTTVVHGKGQVEAGTAVAAFVDGDGAAVCLDDGLADGETDAAGRAPSSASERFEDVGPLVGCDTVALVADGQLDHRSCGRRGHADDRPGGRVTGGIFEEIGDDLVELAVVGVHEGQACAHVHVDGSALEQPLESVHALGDEL